MVILFFVMKRLLLIPLYKNISFIFYGDFFSMLFSDKWVIDKNQKINVIDS
jgi:hypothetical protein